MVWNHVYPSSIYSEVVVECQVYFILQTLIFKLLCPDLAFRCVTQTLISEMDEEPVEKKLKGDEHRSVNGN